MPENAPRTSYAALEERDLLSALMDNVPDAIYFKDAESRFVLINQAQARRFGLSDPAQAVGKTDFDFFTEEYARPACEDEQRIIRTGQPIVGLVEKETWLDRPDTWASTTKMPLRDEKGNIVGIFGISRDITESKQAEKEILQRNQELSALNEIGRALSRLAEPSEILELIATMVGRLLDNRSLYIALYDEANQRLAFPIYTHNGQRLEPYTRPMANSSTEYVIRTRQPLRIDRNVDETFAELGIQPLYTRAPAPKSALSVPMIAGGKVIGVLAVRDHDREYAYTEKHQELLSTIAAQAAIAIENARLYADTRRRLEELSVLNEIDRAMSSTMELEPLFQVIQTQVGRLMDNRNFYIALYDEAEDEVSFPLYAGEDTSAHRGLKRRGAKGITEHIIHTRQPILICRDLAATLEQRGIQFLGMTARSWLGVPLLFGEHVIGVMAVQNYEQEEAYDEEDLHVFESIAAQAAIAVQNARLFQETRQRAREFAALYDTSRDLSMQRDLPTLLQIIVERAKTLLAASAGAIYLFDVVRRDLEAMVATDLSTPLGTRLQLGEGMAGRVAQTGEPLIVNDYRTWPYRAQAFQGEPIGAAIEVPMLYGGELIGVVVVYELGEATRTFADADVRLLSLFAGQAASAVHNARLLEETQRRAHRQEALYRLSTELARLAAQRELCETIVQTVRDMLGFHFLGIFLLEPETGDRVMQAHSGWDDAPKDWRLHPGEGLSEKAFLTGELQYWPDVTREPRYVPGLRESHTELDVPIKIGNSVLGVLIVEDNRVDAFNRDDFEVLQAVANQLAVVLENARLFEDTKRRLAQLTALQETTKAVVSTLELDKLLHLITQQVSTLLHGDGGILNLVNWEKREDEVITASGSCAHTVGYCSPLEEGLSGWVTLHNQPVISNQLQSDNRVDRYVRSGALQSQSAALAPLTIKGQVIGTLVVIDKQDEKKGFDQSDLDLLITFANQAATAIENARLYEAVQQELGERKRAEEALVKRTNELEQAYQTLKEDQEKLLIAEKMASLGRLTAGIAHEMNTPLAAARASLVEMNRLVTEYQNSIGDPEITPDDHREIAQEMQQALRLVNGGVERTANFVRGVKTQTRDLSPREHQRFNAVPAIQEALLLLGHALRKSGCTATFEPAVNYVELNGSPGRLAQVITNLITNSIDASVPKGGGPITLQLIPRSNSIELEVSDRGIGIPPENLSQIFDPLFTTKPFGQGTGLGLTIVHDIVVGEFGGTIEVTSEPGQGATFRLEFPNLEGVT